MNLRDILTKIPKGVKSVGGAGFIILALSGFFGKLWADLFMAAEQHEFSVALEQLRLSHSSEIDVLVRKREVYQRLATTMRIFLSTSISPTEEDKNNFTKAYDLCYLWASDDVVVTLGKFLDFSIAQGAHPRPGDQAQGKRLYARCMTEMRRDAGFPSTKIDPEAYRIFHF